MYEEDEDKTPKCDADHVIKESDENWYACWGPDDPNDPLGTEYMDDDGVSVGVSDKHFVGVMGNFWF